MVSYCPQKQEQEWAQLTAGGNLLDTYIKFSAPTIDITTIKIQLNSMIYTPGVRFVAMGIKNYYLGTPY